MSINVARPNKKPGRVIIGPRQVAKGCARIVACEDGSGRIELYDPLTHSWRDASGDCTFGEIWSAPSVAEPVPDDGQLKVA